MSVKIFWGALYIFGDEFSMYSKERVTLGYASIRLTDISNTLHEDDR